MQRKVRTVSGKTPLPEFERQLVDARVSGFPVVDDGQLVGVVSRSDVIRQLCVERSIAEVTSDYFRSGIEFHEMPLDTFNDIADRVGERIESLRVQDVMNRKLYVVSPEQSLLEVAQMLVEHHIHRIPVTKDKRLLGIISSLDLTRLIAEGQISIP